MPKRSDDKTTRGLQIMWRDLQAMAACYPGLFGSRGEEDEAIDGFIRQMCSNNTPTFLSMSWEQRLELMRVRFHQELAEDEAVVAQPYQGVGNAKKQ